MCLHRAMSVIVLNVDVLQHIISRTLFLYYIRGVMYSPLPVKFY